MIVEAIRWPGFAFIEVLSPCITFRPEEFAWKARVRPSAWRVERDRAAATAAVLDDDGFSLGVLFQGERAPIAQPLPAIGTLIEIEASFGVG